MLVYFFLWEPLLWGMKGWYILVNNIICCSNKSSLTFYYQVGSPYPGNIIVAYHHLRQSRIHFFVVSPKSLLGCFICSPHSIGGQISHNFEHTSVTVCPQWGAGAGSHRLAKASCVHLFPNPCSVILHSKLEIGHGGSIHITEIGKCYQ